LSFEATSLPSCILNSLSISVIYQSGHNRLYYCTGAVGQQESFERSFNLIHGLLAILFGTIAGIALRLATGPCIYTTSVGRLVKNFHSSQQSLSQPLQILLKLIFLIACMLVPAVVFFHLSEHLNLSRDKWSGLAYLITLGMTWKLSEYI
jgi:hypothetical protein